MNNLTCCWNTDIIFLSESIVCTADDRMECDNHMLESFTSKDMLDIFEDAGVKLSNGELSAVLRKEGQRNYRECGDRYARNFLKGLAIRYRHRQ